MVSSSEQSLPDPLNPGKDSLNPGKIRHTPRLRASGTEDATSGSNRSAVAGGHSQSHPRPNCGNTLATKVIVVIYH